MGGSYQYQKCKALFSSGHRPLASAGNCTRLTTQQYFLSCDLFREVRGGKKKNTFGKIQTLVAERAAEAEQEPSGGGGLRGGRVPAVPLIAAVSIS